MRISGCRLKEKTQDRLAEFFVGGVAARSAADLARVNRKTAAYFFHRLRQIIARQLEGGLPLEGLVEIDESYFGGVRKGKRGRGAAGKIPVFGILKRGGKVHTVMIPDVRKGAPAARQGADRFHLMQNLRENIEREMTSVNRCAGRPRLPAVAGDRHEVRRRQSRLSRQALFVNAKGMHAAGRTFGDIAVEIDADRRTIAK
jgi:transposase-like protein